LCCPRVFEGRCESYASSFFSENVTALTMPFTWMIHTSSVIMRLFFHSSSFIFNTSWPKLSKTLYTTLVKFRASTSEHITKTVSIRCHLQSGVHVVHPVQGHTGGSRRVPDQGCEQVGEEQSILLLRLPYVWASWCEVGHCHEGEVRLSCFGYNEPYGYAAKVFFYVSSYRSLCCVK
jgi:hypothetical protein